MSEMDRMRAGLPFFVRDPEVYASKLRAVDGCRRLNSVDGRDGAAKEAAIRDLFGSVGREPMVLPVFSCDTGSNIHVGDYFLANYNVVILDIAEFTAGDNVWIGPNTLITTIGHPLSPRQRREHLGIARPVRLGNDVWIGGNATILPGVTIGSNVVVGAGAVVTKDVPDNSLVLGVPARVVREIPDDTGDERSQRLGIATVAAAHVRAACAHAPIGSIAPIVSHLLSGSDVPSVFRPTVLSLPGPEPMHRELLDTAVRRRDALGPGASGSAISGPCHPSDNRAPIGGSSDPYGALRPGMH